MLLPLDGVSEEVRGIEFCMRGHGVEGVLVRAGRGKRRRVPIFLLEEDEAIDGTPMAIFTDYFSSNATRVVRGPRGAARVRTLAQDSARLWLAVYAKKR